MKAKERRVRDQLVAKQHKRTAGQKAFYKSYKRKEADEDARW